MRSTCFTEAGCGDAPSAGSQGRLAYKRSKGEKTGRPRALRVAARHRRQTLEPSAPEQEVIDCANELRMAGLSMRAVAKDLEARGLLKRAGRRFSAQGVSTALAARPA